jgi:predicted nucleic acid-binding protein
VITAVDSSILIDVFESSPVYGRRSVRALQASLREGQLVACEVAWSEIAGRFGAARQARQALEQAQVRFDPMAEEAALAAGAAWRHYRRRGGRRERMIADFLIGAHALTQADRLLTRDRGFYRSYFSKLRILEPA